MWSVGLYDEKTMTETEIMQRQELTGNREFFLMLVGSFMHAYGHGAFALSRITGYRVMRKHRKSGELLTTGFPIARLKSVLEQICQAGGSVQQQDERIWVFSGLDGTPDPTMINDPQPKSAAQEQANACSQTTGPVTGSWLEEAIRGFDLSMATPLEAMMFLGTLKKRLDNFTAENVQGADSNSNAPGIACESPAGQGLQE